MTTPNQDAPDGAVTVGGGEWKYGQLINERRARQQFEIEPPSNLVEALDMLPFVLGTLPNDAMKPWQKWLGLSDEDTANGTIRQRIVEALQKNRLTKNEEDTQEIIDGVDGSVNGGNNTGNEPGSVRENLLEAWTKFWQGLTGQTGSGKLPSDVQNAAAGVTSTANNANTNATAAAAQAADAAITATNAELIVGDVIESGSNLIVNPSFEKGWFSQGAGTYSYDQARTGERSLKITSAGFAKKYTFLSDDNNFKFIPVRGGDVFYVEVWVRGKSTNTQTSGGAGGIVLTLEPFYGLTELTNSSVSLTASSALNNTWTKLYGYITMPSNASRMRISVGFTNAVEFGEVYYFDDAVVREVTLASEANDNATSAQASATVAGTNADLALVNAQDAGELAGQVVESGSNLIANSDFEKGLVSPQPSVGVYTTDQKYSGERSLRMIANGTTKTFYLLSQGLTPRTIPASAGDVFYCEFYVYGDVINQTVSDGIRMVFEPLNRWGASLTDAYVGRTVSTALNNTWTKVSAYVTMPADTTKFKVGLQVRNTVSQGYFYFDQIIVREVTLANTANTAATSAEAAANTASTAASAAQTTANTATTTANSASTGVQETVDFVHQAVNGGTSTGNARATIRSNLQAAWANFWDGLQGTSGATSKLPSEVMTAAAALKSTADTASTTASAANTNVQTTVDSVVQAVDGGTATGATAATTKTKLQLAWARIFDGLQGNALGTNTSRVTTDLHTAGSALRSATTTAQTTATNANSAASTADGKAVTAQNTVDMRTRDFSNLAGGSDFEGTTQPWTLGTGWSVATDQFYLGTKSLKHTGTAAGTSTLAGTFACLPGEQFYIECYAREDSTFNGTTNDKIRLLNQASTEIGFLGFGAAAISTSNVWVKLSTTVTIPAGTSSFTVTAVSNSTLGSVWLDNIVIRRVATTDIVPTLPQSKITNLSTDLSTIDTKATNATTAAGTAQTTANTATTNLQTTIDGIVQAVDGGTATGAAASTAKTKLQLAWANIWDGVRGTSGATSKLPSEIRTEAAALKAKADTADSTATAVTTNHGTLVDNVTKSFFGDDTVTGASLAQALAAMKKQYSDLAANITAVNELKSAKSATATKGGTWSVRFSNFASVTAAGFGLSYTPTTGTNTIVISNGVAQWNVVDNTNRDAKLVYNTDTLTDFQAVSGTMSAPPQPPNGTTPYFYAIARVSPDGLNYVWARAYAQSLGNYKADIGYCVNGVETTWATNISLTWSLDMRFVAGVGTNVREYQIWSGNKMVYSYTESGTSSRLCSNSLHTTPSMHDTSCTKYRRWGAIAQVRNGRAAGKVEACSAADNGTPSVNGSVARMVRTGTTSITYTGGNAITALPGSFFDSIPHESLDVDAVTSTGTFKVTQAKPYLISARIALSNNVSALGTLILQRSTNNGSTWVSEQYGNSIYTNSGESLIGNWVQYLNAGDMVRLAYVRGGITTTSLTGESTGAQTYFAIASAEGAS